LEKKITKDKVYCMRISTDVLEAMKAQGIEPKDVVNNWISENLEIKIQKTVSMKKKKK